MKTLILTDEELDLLELSIAYTAGSPFGPREMDLKAYNQLEDKIQAARKTEVAHES